MKENILLIQDLEIRIAGETLIKKTVAGNVVEKDKGYWVSARTDDFGKIILIFNSEEESKIMYDKIVESGSVSYSDVLKYDEDEKGYFEERATSGKAQIEETQTSKVSEVRLVKDGEKVEYKEIEE